MKNLSVSDEVYATVQLLAKALGTTEDGVIQRLIEEFRPREDAGAARPSDPHGEPIYALYEGHRIEGRYFLDTGRTQITNGPLAGQSFKSPSGAAIAVVRSHRSDINPNRNGWSFWRLASTGDLLQSIRGHRG